MSSCRSIIRLLAVPTLMGLSAAASAQSGISGGHGMMSYGVFSTGSLPQSYDRDHPKLVAFGRCVARADRVGSDDLLFAYLRRSGLRQSFARLAPAIASCRRKTVAGLDAESTRTAAAFIISAASRRTAG